MPTSIVRIATPEGFVVGADGVEYDTKTKTRIADSVRKVFAVEDHRRLLIYAFSGTNKVTVSDKQAELDLVPLIHSAFAKLQGTKSKSLWHYAESASRSLSERIPPHEEDEEPTVIYIDGYYNGKPRRARIEIPHKECQDLQVFSDTLPYGQFRGCGSEKILHGLKYNHPSVSTYRTPVWDVEYQKRTIKDALDLAKEYIAAQCDENVRRDLDPKYLETIGGAGLICALHSSGKFEWMSKDPESKEWKPWQPPVGPHASNSASSHG